MAAEIYDRTSIAQTIEVVTNAVADWFDGRSDNEFEAGPLDGSEAWTSGQHLDHLVTSIAAVNQAFVMPKFVLRQMFGKPNREGRSYEEVINRYREKLAQGGRASGKYEPGQIAAAIRQQLSDKLREAGRRMSRNVLGWKEKDLDAHLLPHPLLGKMTVREMLFFTIYHNKHHLESLRNRY